MSGSSPRRSADAHSERHESRKLLPAATARSLNQRPQRNGSRFPHNRGRSRVTTLGCALLLNRATQRRRGLWCPRGCNQRYVSDRWVGVASQRADATHGQHLRAVPWRVITAQRNVTCDSRQASDITVHPGGCQLALSYHRWLISMHAVHRPRHCRA